MEKAKKGFFSAKKITYLAVLAALVVVFQACSGFMKIGATPLSFVLVPIVLGGMLLGVGAGAILGGIFGFVVIIDALCGLDAFTLYLLNEQPVMTVFLCMIKGIGAGVASAFVYKLIAKKNKYVAAFVAGATAPIVNTGIFILGALLITEPINELLIASGLDIAGMSSLQIILVFIVTYNFFIELAISLVFSPALYTVNNVVEKQLKSRKSK